MTTTKYVVRAKKLRRVNGRRGMSSRCLRAILTHILDPCDCRHSSGCACLDNLLASDTSRHHYVGLPPADQLINSSNEAVATGHVALGSSCPVMQFGGCQDLRRCCSIRPASQALTKAIEQPVVAPSRVGIAADVDNLVPAPDQFSTKQSVVNFDAAKEERRSRSLSRDQYSHGSDVVAARSRDQADRVGVEQLAH